MLERLLTTGDEGGPKGKNSLLKKVGGVLIRVGALNRDYMVNLECVDLKKLKGKKICQNQINLKTVYI